MSVVPDRCFLFCRPLGKLAQKTDNTRFDDFKKVLPLLGGREFG